MKSGTRIDPSHIPSSTYRLQLNSSFTFENAAEIVDYLDRLGIGDCYLSPVYRASPGSVHGYDVTDHGFLNPEIGTAEDFDRLAAALRGRDMGILLDVVPNHMCISNESNAWWWDVLENGPSSPYAAFFDIDWVPPKEELVGKVLLPILGEQYGYVLENQGIRLAFELGSFHTYCGEVRLPVAPGTWHSILGPALAKLHRELGADTKEVLELESIGTALSYLPPRNETDPERIRERRREKEIIKGRLEQLAESSPVARKIIEDVVRETNGHKGDPRSFDALDRLLADQVYRLSFWRVAADEINYRRFFDINHLAAIRVEDPAVFATVHCLVLRLVREDKVTGLRIDHPDGLFEPHRYFHDLQEACRASRASRDDARAVQDTPFFIVAEKILTGDEELRPWAIAGTVGYGSLNFLNGVFVDSSAKRAFERLYRRFAGWQQSYEDLVYESKKLILQVSLSSELNVLSRKLDRISEQHRWSRDFTLENLRDALREVVACLPVYRIYTGADAGRVDAEDERHIRSGITRAKRRNPAISGSVFDFIQSVLLLEEPEGLDDAQRAERRMFVLRLQQFTGPVMAKGVEDTAFYRYFPLASLNEVGGDPRFFGTSMATFHAKNLTRRADWPDALVATSTHDTKRSEDVRMRIDVLSEMPAEWNRVLRRWHNLNRAHKTIVSGLEAPSPNDEYLLYQTLLGTWPLTTMADDERRQYESRIEQYMEKAQREAKVHTSWVSPDSAYEEATSRFIRGVLKPSPDNRFLDDFIAFQIRISQAGMLNSLSQVVLKTASPGVPDFYQGTELWNFCLVDPDNRRPVDYSTRKTILERLLQTPSEGLPDLVDRLIRDPSDGAIKLHVTSRSLRLRRDHPELFARGEYVPLRAVGERHRHVVAFARVRNHRAVIALAGRFFSSLTADRQWPPTGAAWGDTSILLRQSFGTASYRDVFTGRAIRSVAEGGRLRIRLADAFVHLPVALLELETAA